MRVDFKLSQLKVLFNEMRRCNCGLIAKRIFISGDYEYSIIVYPDEFNNIYISLARYFRLCNIPYYYNESWEPYSKVHVSTYDELIKEYSEIFNMVDEMKEFYHIKEIIDPKDLDEE